MAGSPRPDELTISSELAELQRVKHMTRQAVESLGLGPRECFDVVLAVHEAVVNAITHGNGSDPQKKVALRFSYASDRITVHVRDEGPGFDVQQQLARLAMPPSLEEASGRGVLLITRLMDEVQFNDTGNEVRLTKFRGSS
ncbi:MAG: ATP-binding protein [Armatimonadota bacterium]